jgi:hypothetical protein
MNNFWADVAKESALRIAVTITAMATITVTMNYLKKRRAEQERNAR